MFIVWKVVSFSWHSNLDRSELKRGRLTQEREGDHPCALGFTGVFE